MISLRVLTPRTLSRRHGVAPGRKRPFAGSRWAGRAPGTVEPLEIVALVAAIVVLLAVVLVVVQRKRREGGVLAADTRPRPEGDGGRADGS
jgi:hypothetical protein